MRPKKNKTRCVISGKLVNGNDEVIKIENIFEYLAVLGYKFYKNGDILIRE